MNPVFFFAYPVVGLVALLVGLRLRVVLRARSGVDLSVPAGAAPGAEVRHLEPARSVVGASRTSRRDGQLPPLTAAGQERWARDRVRPGVRLTAAPARCPQSFDPKRSLEELRS